MRGGPMFKKPHCPVIAIEEHYWDDELEKTFTGGEAGRPGEQYTRLKDLGALRLRLHAVVAKNPQRFAAFAALPTAVPEAAADEFERTAALGFKGAMLHGLAGGVFLDDKRFWPIYARAEKLDLPVYNASVAAAGRCDAHLLRGLCQRLPDDHPRHLGLCGGDRDARHPPRFVRGVREISQAENHPRPPRRDATVPGLAHRYDAQATRRQGGELPRYFLQQFLRH